MDAFQEEALSPASFSREQSPWQAELAAFSEKQQQQASWPPATGETPCALNTAEDAAIPCEAVEFEDLFENPIAQGSNLEFRVSMVGNEDANVNAVVKEEEADIMDEEEEEDVIKVGDEEPDKQVALQKLELLDKTFYSQVDDLQRIVNLQRRLTGANPLAQELASAVLGNKEEKQGEKLSTEAVTYLKNVFAIKDTLTKAECRFISQESGATQSQVQEFFATQRSRVKAYVQQCTDEAKPLVVDGGPEQNLGIDLSFTKLTDVESVELLLETMRQELNFTQQEKLLQIILQTEPGLVLRRFLEKGGLKILCAWLVTAAADEQTSVLRQVLQVLSHLPMSCAIPLQVSALLQPVNKLRFYFDKDVANHARTLMSKWSSLFMNKVESGTPVESAGLGPATKDNLDAPQRAQKRLRDTGVTVKKLEGGLLKKRTVESVKVQSDLARALSSGGAMKVSSGLAHGVTGEPKSDLKSKTSVKELPTNNTSRTRVLVHSNARKILPRKGVVNHETDIDPENTTGDEIMDVGGSNPVSSSSLSTQLVSSQAPKARGASVAEDESKGAAKVALRSSSAFPVSDAANIAKPVSRKHSLGDQLKGRRKVLPVEDLGNGNRWREPTARRPVIEVGKTSRPLSADEIRKAKLRARLMQPPTAGSSGNKSASTPELYSSRGKPTPVGDGWSLDRYASMDGGDKPSLVRPTTSQVDAPRQILDENTFDLLLAEQASEAKEAEQATNTQHRSPVHVDSLEKGAESTAHLHDVALLGSISGVGQDTSSHLDNIDDVDRNPLSPSIAVAVSEKSENMVSEVAEDVDVMNEPVSVSLEGSVNITPALDASHAPEESGGLDVIASENVTRKDMEARTIPWVAPSVLNLNPAWGVVAGDASKERGVQAARVKREEEEVYPDLLSIPDNPKDLWDEEPVYDDTLTAEIPAEALECPSPSKPNFITPVVNQGVELNPSTNGNLLAPKEQQQQAASTSAAFAGAADAAPGHDPNLLALLLSNPHLVSQLASSQQKGDSGLAGLSALLGLQNGAAPVNTTNFPAPTQQPRQEIVNTGNFQGSTPTGQASNALIPEDPKPVPSWDVGYPTPPAAAIAQPQANINMLPLPPAAASVQPPPPEFVSPPAYNGSFQKLPNAPYTWAPLNTLMHTTAKLQQIDSRGRQPPPPIVSHNVNGALMMPPPSSDHDDAAAAATSTPSFPAYQNSVPVGWSPQHGISSSSHNASVVAIAAQTSSWNSNMVYSNQQQHQRLPEPPPPPMWRAAAPAPPPHPHPHPHPQLPPSFLGQHNSVVAGNQYWQPQQDLSSFRPAPLPSFRPQDCRPHGPPPAAPQWHPNYGPSR